MLPPITDAQRRLIFLALFSLLLALALVQHVGRMKGVGFTTHDDMALDLMAQEVKTDGLPAYFRRAQSIAAPQGRVSYYAGLVFFLIPYFVQSDIFRALLCAGIHLVSVAALAAFMALYIEPVAAACFLLFYYVLLPHQWSHSPLAAYPAYYHVPTAFFFLGLAAYVARFRGMRTLQAPATKALCYILMGWSLILYEPQSFIFTAVLIGVVLFEGRDRDDLSVRAMLKGGGRRHRGIVIMFLVVAVVYLAYRAGHSPTYEGTAVGGKSLANLWNVAAVVGYFTAFGFPAANFFSNTALMSQYSTGSVGRDGMPGFILNNLSGPGLAFALLFAAAIVFLAWNIRVFLVEDRNGAPSPGRPAWNRRPRASLGLAVLMGLLAAIAVELPVALSPKYQAAPRAWAPYITGYFSYIGFTAALAALVVLAAWWAARRNRTARRAVAIGCAVACFGMAVLNSVASDAMIRSQVDHYAMWRLVNLANRSGEFQSLPDGAVIVAPSLQRGIDPTWEPQHMGPHGAYWTAYFQDHFGKRVHITPDWPAVGSEQPVYYCTLNRGADAKESVLIFGKVNWCDHGACGTRLSDTVAVFSLGDIKGKDLSVETPSPDACPRAPAFEIGRSNTMRQTFPLGEMQSVGDGFRAVVATGGSLLENAVVIPHLDPRPGSATVEIVFDKGFSGLEQAGAKFWRWSDGPSGIGVLSIVNRAVVPLRMNFSTQIVTGRTGTIPCEVDAGGDEDKVSAADAEWYSKTLFAFPGRTEIRVHCAAARLNAPNDPRYIVFGLQNWRAVDAGTFALLRGASSDGIENKLDLKVIDGFSPLERKGSEYWRWSDRQDAMGIVELANRTGKPMKVWFGAEVATGQPEKSKLEISYEAKTESFDVNDKRQPISTELLVPAGVSRLSLKSYAQRVTAPGDARFLTFAIYNWRVVSLEAAPGDFECAG